MTDRSLVSIRNVSMKNTKYSVGIQSNGIYLYNHWITDRCRPAREDAFMYLRPKDIQIENMLNIFEDPALAAEIHASWCMMRRELLQVIYGRLYGNGSLEGVSGF
jgi:hypothetical protein